MHLDTPGDAVRCCAPVLPLLPWPSTALAQERAARRGGKPVDTGARRQEEDAPILTPGQVRGQLRREYTAQQFPSGAAYPHAAWPVQNT
jgi:hypothetical protein